MKKKKIMALLCGVVLSGASFGSTIYVDVNTVCTGACVQDGTDWAHAYDDLQTALSSASSGDEIWVADGTYYPTTGSNRAISFVIPAGVDVYGGFAGSETSLGQRNVSSNVTILSGDIDQDGSYQDWDDSYHVVQVTNITSSVLVDGFTIEMAYAGNTTNTSEKKGAGIYASGSSNSSTLSVVSCTIRECYAEIEGGGIYNESGVRIHVAGCKFQSCEGDDRGGGISVNVDADINDCEFTSCRSTGGTSHGGALYINADAEINSNSFKYSTAKQGGALYHDNGQLNISQSSFTTNGWGATNSKGGAIKCAAPFADLLSIDRCSFTGNYNLQAGAIYNDQGRILIVNSIVKGNNSMSSRGVIHSYVGEVQIVNCTFRENTSATAEASCFSIDSPTYDHDIANCIFYGNAGSGGTEVEEHNNVYMTNNLVEGGWNGTNQSGVIDADPEFVGSSLNLFNYSPCVDAGDEAKIIGTGFNNFDRAGNTRIIDLQGGTDDVDMGAYELQSLTSNSVIYVDKDATGNDDGSSWTHAYNLLQDALSASSSGDWIWVAEGTYYPSNTFVLPSGVSLFGGFAATEDPATFNLNNRDFVTNETVLSGDLNQDGLYTGNTGMVLKVYSQDIVDGFTITMGNGGQGAGLRRYNSSGHLYVENCKFHKNKGTEGAAVYYYGETTFKSCEFSENEASVYAAGLWAVNGKAHLYDCRLVDNVASGYWITIGGAVYCSEGTFMNCEFEDNVAQLGGAIYADDLLVDGCVFTGNGISTSIAKGGAIYADGYDVGIYNSKFEDNVSLEGGAIFMEANNPVVANCSFIDNTSTEPVVAIEEYSNNVSITNCSFSGNTANSTKGSCIGISGSSTSTSIAVENCILYDNNNSGGVEIQNASGISVDYCIVEGGWLGSNQSNISSIDPEWIDSELNIYESSPAVDIGNNAYIPTYVSTDIDGDDRINGTNVDLGSQEAHCPGTVLYVDINTPCTGSCVQDGSDWAHAFADLQDALTLQCPFDEVWVAQGIYYPTSGTDRTIAFEIPSGVSVYGGFNGTETSNTQADPASNQTVLSGDIDQDAILDAQNSYTVVYTSGTITDDVLLDGLIVRDGYANSMSTSTTKNGGGLYLENNPSADVVLNECVVTNNYANQLGGGIYSYVDIHMTNCTISSNTSPTKGGAMHQYYHSMEMYGCVFESNQATSTGKAGCIYINGCHNSIIASCMFQSNEAYTTQIYYVTATNGTIVNSIFVDNVAYNGGVIHGLLHGGLQVVNSSFYANSISSTGSNAASCVHKSSQSAQVRVLNSIFWQNYALSGLSIKNDNDIQVHDCILENPWPGLNQSNVINVDPQWTGAFLDLTTGSPAIDAGRDAHVPNWVNFDFDGDDRFFNSTGTSGDIVDMGAQEYPYLSKRSMDEAWSATTYDELNVYPNPTTDMVTIQVESATTYSLMDASGRLVSQGRWNEGQHQLDLSDLDAGLYHLVAEGDGSYRTTIVKQ